MHIPRLLVLSLLISLCVATAAAQSSPCNSSNSQPAPPQTAQAKAPLEFPVPFDIRRLAPLNAQPCDITRDHDTGVDPSRDIPKQRVLTLLQNEPTCYTIRAYRVARENPDSDVVRPAGYSTCQRASRFQFKTAVDSREVVPR